MTSSWPQATADTFIPTVCLDFDGVIHFYERGWQDGTIYGEATPGFFAWVEQAAQDFRLVVYSSRSKTPKGIQAMKDWMQQQADKHYGRDHPLAKTVPQQFEYASEKPAAWLTVDDRAVRFDGDWRDPALAPDAIRAFKPSTSTASDMAILKEIGSERRRQQQVEGWTPEHDDAHMDGEMPLAAGVYAIGAGLPPERGRVMNRYWPWDGEWYKPSDPRRDLIKAAALIVAEIERLDRREASA